MAGPPPDELRGPQRDGASQAERAAPELDPASVGIDERSPADLISTARRTATRLLWYAPDNTPGRWWAAPETGEAPSPTVAGEPPPGGPAFFDGIGPRRDAVAPTLGYAEVAAFLEDPAVFPDDRFAPLRRPHMALFLTAVRLMRHGQRALNSLTERHYDYHLDQLLGLAPLPAQPDHAFVLFSLAPGVAAAEVPAGTRLFAGRDSRRRDRVYQVETPLVVNRASVARISSSFVDREITGLEDARHSTKDRTPEAQFLFLLGIALGDPNPGDTLPLFRGKPVDTLRLGAIVQLIAFAPTTLFLELFELRALLARKARRATDTADWASINATLEAGGRVKRGDPAFKLTPADPRKFLENLAVALGGLPDLTGLPEVATVDDLALHLDRADVQAAIKTRLGLDPGIQFAPMIASKHAIETDWAIINNYLEHAGQRKRPASPDWTLKIADAYDFATNLTNAIGPLAFGDAGSEATDVTSLETYMARVAEVESWFFMTAEDVARVLATPAVVSGKPEGDVIAGRAWRTCYALLGYAYARKVRSVGAAALASLRASPPPGKTGAETELEAVLGDLPSTPDARTEALARYAAPADVARVRDAFAWVPGAPNPPDWSQIDGLLEDARRRRLRLSPPVAQKQHWRALWTYPDARLARGDDGTAPWPTFGGIPADAGPGHAPAALGFALTSPALALSTGRRRIILTLGFHDDHGIALLGDQKAPADTPAKTPFTVGLTTAKGWTTPGDIAFAEVPYAPAGAAPVDGDPLRALQITITLDEADAPVAPLPDAAAPWPQLRLMLRPVWTGTWFDTAYERFRTLRLARVHVAVAVGKPVADDAPGLWPLVVETENGAVDGKKPFVPFGLQPAVGSELALGHRDLLHKRLTSIGLTLEWLGAPANLANWYHNYDLPGDPPRSFVAQPALIDGAVRTTKLGDPAPLFAAVTAAPARIDRATEDAAHLDPVLDPLPTEVRGWRRYLTLTLSGTDFGHHVYPNLVTTKSIALAGVLRATPAPTTSAPTPPPLDTTLYTVNPPYTPRLKRIALDFTAAHEIDLANYARATAVDRVFHLHPFGIEEAPDAANHGWALLPAHDEEGALYIGLAGVVAPSSLSLLFAMAETGNPGRTGPVRWQYLDAGGWTDFTDSPQDGTAGLAQTGIVSFTLPVATPDLRMPPGPYWLRALVAEGAANAPDIVGIHPHAVSTRFLDEGAAPDHHAAPLPPNSIRALVDPAPGIARPLQPYPSFDGRPAETAAAFRVRAAERLRHKNRALTLWDYERLVLARFPQVHKVKCVPASLVDDAPGTVRLVIIPDIRGQRWADPFQPRAPARLLDQIAAYIAPLAPPTARVVVASPAFVRVRVRLGVRFRPGGDETFDTRRLADHLNRFLAPWAFDEGGDITIGQRISATSIVAFVDDLPFVDFVGGCRLFVSEDGETYIPGASDGDAAETATEDGVLTPAQRHEIDVISDDVFEQDQFSGIGYMKIELDFVVT